MIFSVQAKNKMADSKQILQRRAVGAAKRVKGQDNAGFAAVVKWHATRKLYVTRDTRRKANRHRGLTNRCEKSPKLKAQSPKRLV